jgi:cation diffusion facilitator CzcD-associated flavoprotein CzcO
VLAICDVHIKPWQMTLKEVTIFQKGMQRWIGMPSRMYEKDGERKYKELIEFDNEPAKKRFRDQVMKFVEAYLEKNPNLEPESLVKIDEDMPF